MQIKGKYSWVKHLDFMLIDLVSLLLSFFVCYMLKFNTPKLNETWRRFAIIITLINIVVSFITNPYSGILKRRYYHEIGKGFLTIAINGLCAVVFLYAFKAGADYSREVVFYTYIFAFIVGIFAKYVWKKLLTAGKVTFYNAKKIQLFLISDGDRAEKDIHSIYSTDLLLYQIKGIYIATDDGNRKNIPQYISYQEGGKNEKIPVIKGDFTQYILDNNIGDVMVASKSKSIDPALYKKLIRNGVRINLVIESLLDLQTESQFVTTIGVNKTLSIGTFSFSPSQSFYLAVKRLFDIICGLIGVVVLIPITAAVKIAYLASGDTAKVFYRQKRIGQYGKIINIWKFRSMVPNAGEILEELLKDEKYRKEWEENQKFEHDPRITKVGAFLRKTSIDELPQLLNVFVGDMSLVGPRPLVEGELRAHDGLNLYHKVKPGITGWWGCNGRSNIDYRERLELEYYYVKNCSLYLDILCIIRTIYAVLKKDGAQ